ncbi:GRF1-interacting factor 2-like [Phoenix dactylifera]|uniref:GRF1-interacting factor 2-like n=1 Tax=Phoenix dactylifera TaxID=42345 RepID=A0A8B7BQR8_PHODC|nr:GRF1-interacting factor 2-like [Phoenix dactylifera]
MQQPTHPMASMPPMATQNITTEQIQKYLDENKQLILAILDNQNLGKLTECAQYQAQLQKNLLYLAAIADAQPQAPAARPQTMPHGAMPQGAHYMQQGPMFPPRAPLQFNPQQMQEQQQQQQLHHQPQVLPFPGHMGMRPGAINGMHAMHADPSHGGSADLRPAPNLAEFPHGSSTPTGSIDGRGSKQDAGGAVSEPATGADDHRNSGRERSRDGEPNISEKA